MCLKVTRGVEDYKVRHCEHTSVKHWNLARWKEGVVRKQSSYVARWAGTRL